MPVNVRSCPLLDAVRASLSRITLVAAVSPRNGFLRLILVGLCANLGAACADETVPSVASSRAESSHVLVLKSWRVVKGMVRSRGDGYVIDHRTGREFISSSDVWLVATNLEEAHQKMRDSIQTITPDVNLRLAEWCSGQQMWGTAKQELLDALHQDPYREEAREMLARVIRAQEAAAAPSGQRASTAVESSNHSGSAFPGRALGGLTTELARNFTRQIQPLMSNTCGKCHLAGSGREFVLQLAKRNRNAGTARSEQNLAAIIAQLDLSDVSNSPLLVYSMKPHGGMKSAPFRGRLAEQHHRKLKQWAVEVIQGLGQKATGRASAITARTEQLRIAPRQRSVNGTKIERAGYIVSDDNPHGNARQQDQVMLDQLTDAAKRNRIDPFNPEIFNQRYRSGIASTVTPSRRSTRRSP